MVLTSGTDLIEKQMVDEIAKGQNVLNLGGILSIKQLGALIEQADGLVCVDSFPFHLACALKKPVVALFGPTSDVTWGPWRNPYAKIITVKKSCRPCYLDGCGGSKRSECLEEISLRQIVDAVG